MPKLPIKMIIDHKLKSIHILVLRHKDSEVRPKLSNVRTQASPFKWAGLEGSGLLKDTGGNFQEAGVSSRLLPTCRRHLMDRLLPGPSPAMTFAGGQVS